MNNHFSVNDPLRPLTLADFKGQPELSEHLRIILTAALARKQMPDHILFSGPPGLGKTTLANIIAKELNVDFVATSAPAIEKPGDIVALLSSLRQNSVLFIDEIHRLDRKSEELLYSAMEDYSIDIVIGEGLQTRSIKVKVAPFTLVGATTQAGLLSDPLRDRFGFIGRLLLYPESFLSEIIMNNSKALEFEISEEQAYAIASRSRGTPRIANKLLRRVRDYFQVQSETLDSVLKTNLALDSFGIDKAGLDSLGREILENLIDSFNGGPVGLNTLASSLNEAPSTIELAYEPYLMRKGFIARTTRGRIALPGAYEHLGRKDSSPGIEQAEQMEMEF